MNTQKFQGLLERPDADMVIIYDGQCVFCSAYVKLLRLRSAVGTVELLDARQGGIAALAERELKLDLNEGMLVLYQGRHYCGSDAMNLLSLLSSSSGTLNRIVAAVFRSPTLSRMLYPALRLGRRATLAVLGRPTIPRDGGSEEIRSSSRSTS